MLPNSTICKGEICGVVLRCRGYKPANGFMYWCGECLIAELNKRKRHFLCHECGEFFAEEVSKNQHKLKEHSAL